MAPFQIDPAGGNKWSTLNFGFLPRCKAGGREGKFQWIPEMEG